MSRKLEKESLKKVMANLNKEVKLIENRTLKGMIRGVLDIRRDMDFTPPVIPVDTGNLRQSWFVVTSKGGTPQGSSPKFKGKKAGKLASDHATVKGAIKERALAKSHKGPVVACGFSAEYAYKVHEDYGVRFRRPGAGAGFFVSAIKKNKRNVLEKIKENAKV